MSNPKIREVSQSRKLQDGKYYDVSIRDYTWNDMNLTFDKFKNAVKKFSEAMKKKDIMDNMQ